MYPLVYMVACIFWTEHCLWPTHCYILIKRCLNWLCTLSHNFKPSQQEGQTRAWSDFAVQNIQTPSEDFFFKVLRSSKRKMSVREKKNHRAWGYFPWNLLKKVVFVYADCEGEFMCPLIILFVRAQTPVRVAKSTWTQSVRLFAHQSAHLKHHLEKKN